MDGQSSYDRLLVTKVLLFVLLVVMVYLSAVALAYPFLLEAPFRQVTNRELEALRRFLGSRVFQGVLARGDGIYDAILVHTGAEAAVYGWIGDLGRDMGAVENARVFAVTADNLFDYALTLSYRLSFMLLASLYLMVVVACTLAHSLIGRHRARYSFGDTSVLANLYARSAATWSFAGAFLVALWPGYVAPLVHVASIAGLMGGLVLVTVSLPKLA